jgi:hypothetical protein
MRIGNDPLPLRSLALITGAFWLYALLSAVVFAWGLNASFAAMNEAMPFAPWPMRALQYLLLFGPLLGCYRLSLRLGWQPPLQRALLQLALAIGFALLAYPALVLVDTMLNPAEVSPQPMHGRGSGWIDPVHLTSWLASFADFLVRYGFGLALVTGLAMYKRFRDAENTAALMERHCSEARLSALRMQLSPHTLFNLLHAIRGHIAWDPAAAQEMVVQLADLLRRLLSAGEREFTPLAEELLFTQLYLDLQRRRFADRLTVSLPDPATMPAAWVPSLILQPLVENAVVHGLTGHTGPVRVTVQAIPGDGTLILRVTNDMAGSETGLHNGIGLRNVRERLEVLFGGAGSLSAGPGDSGHWSAEIRLPLLASPPQEIAGRCEVDPARCA